MPKKTFGTKLKWNGQTVAHLTSKAIECHET